MNSWGLLRTFLQPNTKVWMVGCAYFLTAVFSIWISKNNTHATIWISNAILLAAILRSSKKLTWRYFTIGLFADFFANLSMGVAWNISLIFVGLNAIEMILPVLYYYLLPTFDSGFQLSKKVVIQFCALIIAGCFLSGTLAGLALNIENGQFHYNIFSWSAIGIIAAIGIIPFSIAVSVDGLRQLIRESGMVNCILLAGGSAAITIVAVVYLPTTFVIVLIPLLYTALCFGYLATAALVLLNTCIFMGLHIIGFHAHSIYDGLTIYGYGYYMTSVVMFTALIVAHYQELRKRNEVRLRESEERFRCAMKDSAIGMAVMSLEGKWLSINNALCQITGYDEETLMKLSFQQITHLDDLPIDIENLEKIKRGEIRSYGHEKRYIRKSGESIWVYLVVSSVFGDDGLPLYIVSQIENIDARKKAEAEKKLLTDELHAEKERLSITLKSIGDAVIAIDSHCKVTFLNPVAEKWLGCQNEDTVGKHIDEICHLIDELTGRALDNPFIQSMNQQQISQNKEHAILVNHEYARYYVRYSVSPLYSSSSVIIGSVMVLHDVTSTRKLQLELAYQASHDVLTGLVNRREFEKILTNLLGQSSSTKVNHTLCFLDLDRFKLVNDTAGHEAGDELLKRLSDLLKRSVRNTDVVARLGGDEFALILPDCPSDRSLPITQKVVERIRDLKFNWQDKIYQVGVSVGMVNFQSGSIAFDELLKHADTACYSSKYEGGGTVSIYSEESSAAAYHAELHLVSTIEQALAENKFQLYALEIRPLNAHPQHRKFYEILLRMVDNEGNILLPKNFMSIAERHGYMPSIDTWVVRQILDVYSESIRHRPELGFSINLSPHTISSAKFLEFLKAELFRTSLARNQIGFEFTEKAMMDESEQSTQFLQFIRNFGCFVSLDDFGSNLSSFTYLKQLPLKYIKIDGQLITKIDKNEQDRAIVEAINDLAHKLDAKTIAEFVETTEILQVVKEIGIDSAQGYAINHAIPLYLLLEKTPVLVPQE